MFLLLSNSRILRSTIRKGYRQGGWRHNCRHLLWWSTPPCNPVHIFPGTHARDTWRLNQISAIFCTYTICIFVPNPATPNKSLVDTHWSIYFLKKIVNCVRRRQKRHKAFYANDISDNSDFYWDTGGIPFVVNNSATEIMRNKRKLLTGSLTLMSVTLETAEGMTKTTKVVGSLRLVLNNDSNKHHVYSIPRCFYDPESPLKTLGVPALGAYFDDGTYIQSPLEDDRTTIKFGGTKFNCSSVVF